MQIKNTQIGNLLIAKLSNKQKVTIFPCNKVQKYPRFVTDYHKNGKQAKGDNFPLQIKNALDSYYVKHEDCENIKQAKGDNFPLQQNPKNAFF